MGAPRLVGVEVAFVNYGVGERGERGRVHVRKAAAGARPAVAYIRARIHHKRQQRHGRHGIVQRF
jgi:hypothetical protein